MKKIIRFIAFICIFTFVFVGCTQQSTKQNKSTTPQNTSQTIKSTTQESTTIPTSIEMTEEEIIKMSNYMNSGYFELSGSWIYGMSFNDKGNGVLSKTKIDELSKMEIISSYHARYININNGWIYFLACNHDTNKEAICKARLSGKDRKTLVKTNSNKENIDHMFIYNDKIYYSINDESKKNTTGALYCCDLDGKNKVKILNKAVYYPYIIQDKLYYQDDNDYCKIHVCDLDGKNDKVFINEWVYQYICTGDSFYYITYKDKKLSDKEIRKNLDSEKVDSEKDYKRIIKKCDIYGKNNKKVIDFTNCCFFSMNKNTLVYIDRNDAYRAYTYDLKTGDVDLLSQNDYICDIIFLNETKVCYFDNTKNYEYTDNIMMCNIDGTNEQILVD